MALDAKESVPRGGTPAAEGSRRSSLERTRSSAKDILGDLSQGSVRVGRAKALGVGGEWRAGGQEEGATSPASKEKERGSGLSVF